MVTDYSINDNRLDPERDGCARDHLMPEQSEFFLIGSIGATWHISQMFNKNALCGARVAKKKEVWRRSILQKERVCWLCSNRIEAAMVDQFRRRAGL